MIGTLINAAAIILGTLIGLLHHLHGHRQFTGRVDRH